MNDGDFRGQGRMMDLAELARATRGRMVGEAVAFSNVTTDSRTVAPGDLFVALQGERFDGNEYVADAHRRGAVAALTSREVPGGMPQVVTDDTRAALGRLAAHWRSRYALALVALTGSNGKTTVKEMLAAILAAHCGMRELVLATVGNLNNDIGMPLTLLRLREHHRYAVVEMGMNHEGELSYLTRLAQPGVAIVNNAQRAHVGTLGNIEAIARAKGEVYEGLGSSGVAVINEDDAFAPYWKGLNKSHRVVTFGLASSADVRATSDGGQLRVVTPTDAFAVTLQVAGTHNVRNALAACAAAHALGIPFADMQHGLRGFAGVPGRLQRRRTKSGHWLIDDSYNANPESMKAAVDVLAAEGGQRVFVMGDMGEMGDQSPALHAEIGTYARQAGIQALFALGDASRKAAESFGSGGRHFEDIAALIEALTPASAAGATVLVKGSRFMQMERVADALAASGNTNAA